MGRRSNSGVMWRPTISLLWLAAVANSSVLVPRYTNDSLADCSADCFALDIQSRWYWQKQLVTATLTAATVIYIVNDRTNTTRTETKYNELPDGVTTPPTNSRGTHVTTFPVETAKGEFSQVVLAYPTEFHGYPLSYAWYGTLPTIDAVGNSICSTVDREKSSQYVDFSSYQTPAQEDTATVDTDDPKGYIYSLMGFGCQSPVDKTINPNDAAPNLCSSGSVCGVAALDTVQFLTDTSVSHETGTADPTPAPVPADSTSAAGAQQAQQVTSTTASPAGGSNNNAQQPAPTPAPAPKPTTAPIVVGSQTVTANSQGNFVVSGQTLSQGAQIVAGGTTVSLAKGGSIAVVNGATQSLIAAAQPATLTVNGQVVTANSAGQFVVGGSTLAVGSAITLGSGSSKTTISLGTNQNGQTVAVVNGKSSTLAAGKTGGVGDAVASGLGGTSAEQFTGAGNKFGVTWSIAMIPLVARLFWGILQHFRID